MIRPPQERLAPHLVVPQKDNQGVGVQNSLTAGQNTSDGLKRAIAYLAKWAPCDAKEEGIPLVTLGRAKKRLGIMKYNEDGTNKWRLPVSPQKG